MEYPLCDPFVMPALLADIHVFDQRWTWMAGKKPRP
jgi:hypothetical protein